MGKPFTKKLDPDIAELLAKRNVVSVGWGLKITDGVQTNKRVWIVTVERKVPLAQLSAADLVPVTFRGLSTDVIEGKMPSINYLAAADKPRTDKWRPAPGGVSIGHFEITAGTLSCLVHKNGELFMLSNNHIFANCNDAEPGDPIIQPGAADGGSVPADEIGDLEDFVPYEFGSSCPFASTAANFCNFLARVMRRGSRLKVVREAEANLVDCAIARPYDLADVEEEILGVGVIKGVVEPSLGIAITKSGRTTGLTRGVISQIDVSVNVSMGAKGVVTFSECFVTNDMGDPGDSGSLAVDENNQAVGLLFAGSDTETIFCKFSNVKKALGLD